MDVCHMEFTGKLLKRGFWLYVWDIKESGRRHLYVGRTGDSSSPHASSPFRRIGQHLDSRLSAKGRALANRLKREAIDPETCTFEMTAVGPIFAEQQTMPEHKPFRDRTAALERALAEELKRRGYHVLGTHPKAAEVDHLLMEEINEKLGAFFPMQRRSERLTRFRPVRLKEGQSASEIIIQDRGRD